MTFHHFTFDAIASLQHRPKHQCSGHQTMCQCRSHDDAPRVRLQGFRLFSYCHANHALGDSLWQTNFQGFSGDQRSLRKYYRRRRYVEQIPRKEPLHRRLPRVWRCLLIARRYDGYQAPGTTNGKPRARTNYRTSPNTPTAK